ncbi:MAG: hypothetical protein KBA11_08775 [Sedimentibacter sp.]|nr:hypothetical protein [Sedimentibacter sp.]
MKKILTIIELIIIIFSVIIMNVCGQNSNTNQLENHYKFITQWGSIGDGDGQFGGIIIAPESTFIITDEAIKNIKNKTWYKITKEVIEKLPDKIDKNKLETVRNTVFYQEEKLRSKLTSLNFNEDEIQIIFNVASKKLDDKKLNILEALKNKEFSNDYKLICTLEELNFDDNELFIIAEASALKRASDEVVNGPLDIVVDISGNVYVSDFYNCRIQKFDSDGKFLTKWGIGGNGVGQFDLPEGIAVDSNNYVYVVDSENNRIQKFDSNGNFILKWGSYGSFDEQFANPNHITVDCDNYIYVNNAGINIQKFDSCGNFIKKWNPPRNPLSPSYNSSVPIPRYGGSMAIDPNNNLFIVYYIYYPKNSYIHKCNLYKNPLVIMGEEFFGEGKCEQVIDLTLDSKGNIFAVDRRNHCVYKIDHYGNLITQWGSYGSGPGEFNRPEAIAVDHEGNVYVMDTGNYRIQKFAPNPEFKTNN